MSEVFCVSLALSELEISKSAPKILLKRSGKNTKDEGVLRKKNDKFQRFGEGASTPRSAFDTIVTARISIPSDLSDVAR
jgi:hypothetical protein